MLTNFEKKHVLEEYAKWKFIQNPFGDKTTMIERTVAEHSDFLNYLEKYYNISKKKKI